MRQRHSNTLIYWIVCCRKHEKACGGIEPKRNFFDRSLPLLALTSLLCFESVLLPVKTDFIIHFGLQTPR
jgi:hypothetical protein